MHERTKYLIQHRTTKTYIQASIEHNGRMATVADPWKAWGTTTPDDALHVLETSPYMPEDRESYRIVKVIDTREVSEDESVPKDR